MLKRWKKFLMKSTGMITKNNPNFTFDELSEGRVFLIDKDPGFTSFDVVNLIRSRSRIKKVGHAGTLDPAATGLLIICSGKKTKVINEFQGQYKTYEGTIYLGKTTASMDGETEFIEQKDVSSISLSQIENVRASFMGRQMQIPPMYSALKHKGKALYKYARQGVTIEREPREFEVFEFKISKINMPEIDFEIRCTKGTYIRVIANDFGAKLGCGAYLSSLRRTKIGDFDVENALTISELKQLLSEGK